MFLSYRGFCPNVLWERKGKEGHPPQIHSFVVDGFACGRSSLCPFSLLLRCLVIPEFLGIGCVEESGSSVDLRVQPRTENCRSC